MKYYIKVEKYMGKNIITIYDQNLKGKVFEENPFILDLRSDFFDGEINDEIPENIINLIKNDSETIAFCVGENTCKVLIENKIIDNNDVKRIKNVPFVMIVNIRKY